jgi:Short C-terminal domain
MRLRYPVLSLLLVVLLVFSAFQSAAIGKKVDVRTVWETDYGTIRLVKEIGKAKGYAQPKEFYGEEMYQILFSLYYSQYEYFHWRSPTRVFEEGQAWLLARPFQDAFLKAGPDDVVEFYFVVRTKKFFGIAGDMRATRGKAFIQGDNIHFVFDQMYQIQSDNPSGAEDRNGYSTQVSWKLVPEKGQRYGMAKDAVGKEREDPHWILTNLQELLSRGSETGPAVQPAVIGTPQQTGGSHPKEVVPEMDAKDKLQKLKEMLQQGLITREDYDRKKKEILNSF